MEVGVLFGRFVWRGINIYDVTIHPSRGSWINPTLNVCEHNRAAHASLKNILKTPEKTALTKHLAQSGNVFYWDCAHVLHDVNS